MKTLFTGGVKSGKSRLAEIYILERAGEDKPYYLATTEFFDDEMQARIEIHRQRRQDAFITLEAPVKLFEALKDCRRPVLIECVSMWLNNMLYHQVSEAAILQELLKFLVAFNVLDQALAVLFQSFLHGLRRE